MKFPVIIYTLLISILLAQVPIDYKFSDNNRLNRFEDITEDGLNSNSIVDIRAIIDSTYLLLSTASGFYRNEAESGLSYVYINDLHPNSNPLDVA